MTAAARDGGTTTALFITDEGGFLRFARPDPGRGCFAKAEYVLVRFEPHQRRQGKYLSLGTFGTLYVQVNITGKAPHAGAAPERGVNALVEGSPTQRAAHL